MSLAGRLWVADALKSVTYNLLRQGVDSKMHGFTRTRPGRQFLLEEQ